MTARKPIMALEAEAEEPEMQALTAHDGVPLKRSLSAVNLVSLGIGAIIGAGIFVLTGHAAAANAGPAIMTAPAGPRPQGPQTPVTGAQRAERVPVYLGNAIRH
jgi:hypothetical protein